MKIDGVAPSSLRRRAPGHAEQKHSAKERTPAEL